MKNKASLVLMEQLLMVLVFALAAALCLQAFAGADTISRQTQRQDEAVLIAQNAAELLKSGADPETVLETGEYALEIREQTTGIPGVSQAEILVSREGEVLFSLTAGWQEVGP